MHFLVIACVFSPEPVVSAQTSEEIAHKLVQRGHKVTVVASFPNRPQGRIFPGYRRTLFSREIAPEGYSILRLFSFFSSRSTLFSRWLENLTFGLSSGLALLFLPRPDLIYANTWPILAQGLICFVARFRKIPIVLSIQDIYPESLQVQGRISKKQLPFRILRWLDRYVARASSALIVISNRFAELYTQDRGVPAGQVHLVPNWADPHRIQLVPPAHFRQRIEIPPDAFVFGYSGNISSASGLENILQAFAQIKQENVFLLIAGDGDRRIRCEELVRQLKLRNVVFHHPWLSEETSEVLAAADVLLLPTCGDQSLVSVPSKILNYMFSARPIFAIALPASETAQVVTNAACGWVISPDETINLGQKFAEIIKLPSAQLVKMGICGRTYALKYFTSEVSLPKVIKVLEQVAQDNRSI